MPIYAYKCRDCGDEAEYIQKFSDPPMTDCEKCGGRIEKQITAAAFHLKGGGWYKDGYASSKPGSGDGGADKPESGAAAKSEKGADAPPKSDGGKANEKKPAKPKASKGDSKKSA